MSQDLLAKTDNETVTPEDTKDVKQLTKTIIDRFFNTSAPNAQVNRLSGTLC